MIPLLPSCEPERCCHGEHREQPGFGGARAMSLPAVTCCQHGALRRRSKGREITGMDALGLPALPKPRLPPAMGARPRTCSAHTAPVTPRVYRPHTHPQRTDSTHTQPQAGARTHSPWSLGKLRGAHSPSRIGASRPSAAHPGRRRSPGLGGEGPGAGGA